MEDLIIMAEDSSLNNAGPLVSFHESLEAVRLSEGKQKLNDLIINKYKLENELKILNEHVYDKDEIGLKRLDR